MMEITVHEAKTQLSKLLARASAGEEVIITSGRNRRPIAKLTAIQSDVSSRIGFAKGIWPEGGPEFFEPLSDEELALWEGEGK
jgi:prevent-host-death family protein